MPVRNEERGESGCVGYIGVMAYSGFHSSGEVISGFCLHMLSYSSLHSDAKFCNLEHLTAVFS
jgi:hypothetical protein